MTRTWAAFKSALWLLVALLAVNAGSAAYAAVTFSLRTGDDLTRVQSLPIDSNQCPGQGPRAVYVGGVVTNTGTTTVTNIVASLGPLESGFFLAGGQNAVQRVGALGPNQSTGVYWYIGYGCTDLATTTATITVTSSTLAYVGAVTLTGRTAISANAGGQVINSVLGPGAVVGQTIFFDTSFSFGGSLVADEFFLQPSGSQSFNAGCFRLVGSQILSSDVVPISVGKKDSLYFRQTVRQSGTGYTVRVRYFFEYQCAGASTTARPYAVQTSGSTNIKYTGNFDGADSSTVVFPSASNPFTISKTSDVASATSGARSTVKYTVTVSNPSSNDSRISEFVDTLPSGATFVALDAASDVKASNSSSVPAVGATGTLTFLGKLDESYMIPAGGTAKLIYTVSMPSTAGTYRNTAQARFGVATTAEVSSAFTVVDPAPLGITKVSHVASDPVNGTGNPKLIPGSRVSYSIVVTNPNSYATTADSIVVVDTTPVELRLSLGSGAKGPVTFREGAVPSGLTFSYLGAESTTDGVDFSNDAGASWTYAPSPQADGTDPAVTKVRIRPKGSMVARSSFEILLDYIVK